MDCTQDADCAANTNGNTVCVNNLCGGEWFNYNEHKKIFTVPFQTNNSNISGFHVCPIIRGLLKIWTEDSH